MKYHFWGVDDENTFKGVMCPNPEDRQEGGDHYRKFAIQPLEFSQKNKLPFCEANVVKYVCRHRDKGGAADIRKAIHCLELLLKYEYGEYDA